MADAGAIRTQPLAYPQEFSTAAPKRNREFISHSSSANKSLLGSVRSLQTSIHGFRKRMEHEDPLRCDISLSHRVVHPGVGPDRRWQWQCDRPGTKISGGADRLQLPDRPSTATPGHQPAHPDSGRNHQSQHLRDAPRPCHSRCAADDPEPVAGSGTHRSERQCEFPRRPDRGCVSGHRQRRHRLSPASADVLLRSGQRVGGRTSLLSWRFDDSRSE